MVSGEGFSDQTHIEFSREEDERTPLPVTATRRMTTASVSTISSDPLVDTDARAWCFGTATRGRRT